MKSQVFLLLLVVGEFSIHKVLSDNGKTFYVRPSETNNQSCPASLPCETLQYYLDNVDTTLNRQVNVTMIFLNGTHVVNSTRSGLVSGFINDNSNNNNNILILTPVLRMVGESEDVVLTHEDRGPPVSVTFYNSTALVLVNLLWIDWRINVSTSMTSSVQMSSVSLLNCESHFDKNTQVSVKHSMFEGGEWLDQSSELVLFNCTFLNVLQFAVGYTVRVENCSFINSPMQVAQNDNVLTLLGVTVFKNTTQYSALVCSNSNVVMSGAISFENNHGVRGGAMSLYLTTLNITLNTNVTFSNNSAEQWGGAIYVAPGIVPDVTLNSYHLPSCFYSLLNCSSANYFSYNFVFEGNSATYGGDDIYGFSSIAGYCYFDHPDSCQLVIHGASSSNSSISSAPLRACICDDDGKPQCENNSYITVNYDVYPGELFTIPLVLVGGDLGLTTGTVYASIYHTNGYMYFPTPTISPDYGIAVASTSTCTEVDYTIHSKNNSFVSVFLTSTVLMNPNYFYYISRPSNHCDTNNKFCFLFSQVFINFTILSCPPGFTLLEDPPRCDCYPLLTNVLNVTCNITKQMGFFSWTGNVWMNVQESKITYNRYCPHDYCTKGDKRIDLLRNSSSQCDFNRAGQLCGRCKDGHSLAIGSSNCILCHNSNNLSLLVFFAVAGFLLVFFIGFLNITVTQGMINGQIFYANIMWTYKDIFFYTREGSMNAVMIFLKTFIAWINLDFGVETCFVEGFTAFWKTWLQFVFPLYVWAIAGLLIVASRCSMKLTKLLGNRAVPLLATLFLLSYMKLLCTAVSALEFSILSQVNYTNTIETISRLVVWSEDGNLGYFEFPHFLLFMAGLVTLLFLWMPYTLLLFFIQWLRRLPQRGPLKWIMKLLPLYDAYLAPLKHKHHYWLGVLLLARGILLVTFASSFAIPQTMNLLLFIFGLALLYYMVLTHPYKSRAILILQSSYLMNIVFVSGFVFFTYTQPNGGVLQSVAVGLSTGLTFLQFCGTVLYAVMFPWCCWRRQGLYYREDSTLNISDGHKAELVVGDKYSRDHEFRDSILNESESENRYGSF